MRLPKYLSPSSITCFYADRQEYYLRYLADQRPPRFPQTQPMSIGSAFDAFVKCYLEERLFGEPRVPLDDLFKQQVEEQHRDWAWENGKYVFDCYKRSGAIADLMRELEKASDTPKFELTIEGKVPHTSLEDGVPLLGKPDCYFHTAHGHLVILDWKVNGYCSASTTSPKKGYLKIRDGWDHDFLAPSRSHNQAHKNAHPMSVDGFIINGAEFFEDIDKVWANQLSIYGWVLGAKVGDPTIMAIEQIVCKGSNKPDLRIASHRGKVSEAYQRFHMDRIAKMWKIILSGHIFDDLSYEASMERQQQLDEYHKAFQPESDDPNEQWFQKIIRS